MLISRHRNHNSPYSR